MKITLVRTESSAQGTFGVMRLPGSLIHTAELPWKNNEPKVSCIPAGTYPLAPWNSKKFPKTYHVESVPGRLAILTHQGNLAGDRSRGYLSHVLGCIAVGLKRGTISGQKAVLISVSAMRIVREVLGTGSHTLTIINDF